MAKKVFAIYTFVCGHRVFHIKCLLMILYLPVCLVYVFGLKGCQTFSLSLSVNNFLTLDFVNIGFR